MLVSAGHDKSIKTWNIKEKCVVNTIDDAHSDWILSIAVDSSGKVLFSSGEDRFLKIWCIETGRLILNLGQIHQNTVQCLSIMN